MKINPEKLKKLGSGTEKRVYEDPNNPDRALGIFYENKTESVEMTKGRFYLTKILHLLFPKNVPDMHLAASDPHVIVVDKIENGSGKDHDKSVFDEDRAKKDYKKFYTALDDFNEKLKSVGIDQIDAYSENFIFDKDGNFFFVDSFNPWGTYLKGASGQWSSELWFDKEKLELALQNLEDGKKDLGLSYLKRLEELRKKELENIGNKNDTMSSKK